jgi:predicted ATP-dependent serine protease
MATIQEIETHKKLVLYDGEDRVDLAKAVLDEVRKKPRKPPMQSGLGNLDLVLKGGFFPGQLIVISGTTGMGKTTLAQTFTINLLEKHLARPLWFSYEVAEEDFLEVFEKYDPMSLEYITMPRQLEKHHLVWIEERIIESYLKFDTRAVFIDHLHRLVDMNSRQNLTEQIGNTVISLKQMALRHEMVMFLICHISQDATKSEKELGLGSVRDSSFIEQEADTSLYTWRHEDGVRNVLKVAKNRKGGVINVRFPLIYQGGRYFEQSRDEQYHEEADRRDARRGRSGMGKGAKD